MRVIRALSTISAVLLAAIGLLLFLGMLMTVPATLEHDRQIDRAFLRASSWVDTFKEDNGRLPSNNELQAWSGIQDESFWLKLIEIIPEPATFPSEVTNRFGRAADGGYLLGLWRGEWNEYFASWAKASTISNGKDLVLFVAQWVIGSLLFFALSYFLWRFGRAAQPIIPPDAAR